ncbi:MAG: hypothetical protein P4L41_14045 [Flavipsychrobacter sp.]|nr:hypothetical protein [Flavipsychrobacter sp.]
MKIFFSLLLLAAFCHPPACNAQQLSNNYTDINNSPGKEMFELWKYYYQTKPGTKLTARLWDEEEVKKNRAYDIIKNYECSATYADRCYVLKISKIDSGIYALKVAMAYANDTNEVGIVSNLTYLIKNERRGLRLANYFYYSTRNWKKFFTKTITFYTPPEYAVNSAEAQKSERFLGKMYNTLNLSPRTVSYYVTPTCEQMQQAIGIDEFVGNGATNSCSCMDTANNIIFSGGKGFYDPQDLVRVAGGYFPKAHPIFMTGLTGLLGGYNDRTMSYYQKQFLTYLEQHPDFQITDLPSFYEVDQEINPQYLVGAVFCAVAMKKDVEKLKKLLSYGTRETDFYMAIYKELNVTRNNAKDYFLTQLKDPELFKQYQDF